jgi:predicted RNA-binding protein with PUA-like domain
MSRSRNYWLVKTEEDIYPITKLKKDKVTQWTDVRNFEARKHLLAMKRGDKLLIYHSNASPSGIAGLGVILREAYPDPGQFDRESEYFDEKATKDSPRWFAPDVKFLSEFKNKLTLEELRAHRELKNMVLFKRSRLSVQPVTAEEFEFVLSLASVSRQAH